jgi:hydrogenase maturation protease
MLRVLVIAIGNPLRCDDGLAWHAADELSRDASPPEILRVHQLTPELAEAVSQATTVIFVDAAAEGTPGKVAYGKLTPSAPEVHFTHHFTPAAVLALAETLYGAHPTAFSVTMAGECFDHGDSLSPCVIEAMPLLLAKIRALP